MATNGDATTQPTQQRKSVPGAVCDVRTLSQSQSQSQPQSQSPAAGSCAKSSGPPSLHPSTSPPASADAAPSSAPSASSTSPPPRSSPLCEVFGECVCQADAASDLSRADELDLSTSASLRRMRSTLRRAEARLDATEAANHRAAVTGPQTGRARRSHQMTESWLARQRRMLRSAKAEVEVLEKQLEASRLYRELAEQAGEREGENACLVM